MPLDLKYRPQKFGEVLGNKAVVKLFHQLSRDGKLTQRSLMFGGPKGCGKTSLARIIACAIVCDNVVDGEPCGECEFCRGVRTDSAENLEEFDAATQGSVEHMRNIVSDLDYGNLSGKPSLYILDEAQRLTKQAQDALLKSVEERRLLVILCTTEPHKIQGPLRSRLTEFSVSAPPAQDLESFLRRVCSIENIQASDEVLRLIVQIQESCPRTSLTSLETLSSVGEITVDDVKTYFRYGSLEKLVKAMESLTADPRSALVSISELLDTEGPSWVRDNAVLIISSAVRMSIGAKPSLPIPGAQYTTRGISWVAVAKSLSSIERPTAADIEVTLMEMISSLPSAPAVAPITLSTPPIVAAPIIPAPIPDVSPVVRVSEPIPEVKKEPARRVIESKPKVVEIGGVNFSADEKLTSVDDKLERGSRGAPVATTLTETPGVRLDKDLHPMAPKEFARGLIQRFKGTE